MARNGSGTFSNPYPNFVSGTVISSTQVDANNSDIATALTQSIAVDGQSTVTANLPMNAKKLTGLAVGAAATDSLNLGQAQAEAMVWCGTAGGSANAITLSPTPAITAYAAGQRFVWKASGSVNTGATTVAISGLGTIALQDNGAALVAGNHAANKIFMGILDTTSTVQVMQVQISGTDPLLVSSLTVSGDALIGDDLTLNSDAAILGFGENTDVTLTHVHDTGLLLNSTRQLQFNDASQYINAPSATVLDVNATDEIELNATLVDVNANLDVSGTATVGGASQFNSTVTVGVDGTGYDVTFYGDTASRYVKWDESADSLLFSDNAKAVFGDGSDLQIVHDGSNSKIVDSGTGDLLIAADNNITFTNAAVSENKAIFTTNGGVTLYYDNAIKFATVTGGVAVTGDLTATGTVEPAGDTSAGDNAALGYTSVLGAILTGQGSTNDVTIVNDADATVLGIPTGTTNVAVTGDLTANNFAGRNKIIGGDFTTNPWQRGTSFAAIANLAYFADRWKIGWTSSARMTASKAADAPTAAQAGTFTQHCISLAVTTADTSIAAADLCVLTHVIEGLNAASFGFGQAGSRNVTLSFWVKGTKTGIHCVSIWNSAGSRSYVAEYTIDSTNTWEYKTITIPVDTTGTWLYTNGIGLRLDFSLMTGTNWHTSADTWAAGAYFSTSNQVNAVDSTSNTFKIALVQLEAGSVATTFDARSVGTELALCQRYYFRETAADVFAGFALSMVEAATYSSGMVRGLPVTMRAAPTCNTASTRLFDGTVAANVTSLGTNRSSPTTWGLTLVGSSGGLTVGRAVSLQASGTVAAYIDASAEL